MRKRTPKEDLEEILRLSAGRRFIRRLLDETGIDADCFVPGDTHTTARFLGARSVGQALLNNIRQNHQEMYLRMVQDEYEEKQTPVDI